jgi:hypothetical protein
MRLQHLRLTSEPSRHRPRRLSQLVTISIERSERADGGPLAYRVTHRVKAWQPGDAPRVERSRVEGTLPMVI